MPQQKTHHGDTEARRKARSAARPGPPTRAIFAWWGGKPTCAPSRLLQALKIFSPRRMQTGLERSASSKPPNFPMAPHSTPFTFRTKKITQKQVPCYIAFTTAETHRIIAENVHRSPMYSGQIQSIGPRYCPSIEDKIVKFPDKTTHQLFLEPEGLNTHE